MEPAVTVAAELDGIRLSDWIDAAGLSRSTAYELLRLLAIEPEPRKVATSRKPVSHLTDAQLQQLEPWAQELRRGTPLAQLRDRLGQSQTVPDNRPGSSEIIPDSSPGQSQIVPADAVAALAAALQPPAPPVDPLRRARLLADAADLGVPLTTAEVAEITGMAASTVSNWADGHSPRPGFRLRRQKVGAAVWWRVDRPGLSETVPALAPAAASTERRVGFDLAPAIEAHATVLSRISLPSW